MLFGRELRLDGQFFGDFKYFRAKMAQRSLTPRAPIMPPLLKIRRELAED